MPIIQKNNGTRFEFTLSDEAGSLPLEGATVFLRINDRTRTIEKQCEVSEGICFTILTAEDLSQSGTYTFQPMIRLANGHEYAAEATKGYVGNRI